MSLRLLESGSVVEVSSALELVDAVAAAVDTDRVGEVERVRTALEPFGLAEVFADELRLSGVPSRCDGECWAGVA